VHRQLLSLASCGKQFICSRAGRTQDEQKSTDNQPTIDLIPGTFSDD
jgi:hypothetical protein